MSTIRTAGRASKLLDEYEKLNDDLPESTRRMMAIFVLAPKVGTEALEELFQCNLGQTPFRHRAWIWYMALRTSGLEPLWDEFAERHNRGDSMQSCLRWLRSEAGDERWRLLSNRLGEVLFNDRAALDIYKWHDRPQDGNSIWTKGGTWDRRNGMTKIIVLGEHIEREPYDVGYVQDLDPQELRTLESELYNLINPDKMLAPQARHLAVKYTRRRIADLAGWKTRMPSYKTVSWFFQTEIQDPSGGAWLWKSWRQSAETGKRWDWFPATS